MNAVTEVMDELRKALALVDQLGDARDKAERELAELQRRTSEALAQAVEWQRERDEAWADLARSVAAWEAAGMQGRTAHDALIVIAEERDEARASLAQIRRVFGNAIAFDDARGDIVKMAEIAYRGACDGDKAVGELRGVTRQRDEAREELSKLRQDYDSVLEANVSLLDGAPYVDARAAFRRGAEAMREHIAEVTGRNAALEWVVELVRALPIPEEP